MSRVATLVAVCAAVALAGVVGAEGTAPVRFEKDKGITEPVIVSKASPVYPEDAKKDKVEGTVVIDATIDVAGKVVDARVVTGAEPRLDKAALEAVRQWTYKPARNAKGTPVAVIFTVTVRFTLR